MEQDSGLREISINQALCRPDHIWGVERELVLATLVVMVTIVVLSVSFWGTVFGIVMWLIIFNGLLLMAKADPMMSKIYLKHIKYSQYYPARSTPFTITKKTFKG